MEKEKRLIEKLLKLKEESSKLPQLSKEERKLLEAENKFQSVYHSNKLEGNHLKEKEARDAILSKDL